MINQHNLLRRLLQSFILILSTAAILSYRAPKKEAGLCPVFGIRSGIYLSQAAPDRIEHRVQEAVAEKIKRNMPEIEVSQGSLVDVTIHNEEEYRAFINCLEEYVNYGVLTLDLEETDTVIYLDEILAYHNFGILSIEHGGTISARNMKELNTNPLRDIELYHPYAIEEDMLSRMPNLQYIMIRLNSWYTGVLPTKELLQNTDCGNITVIWDDNRKGEENLEEFAEWDEINAMLSEDDHYLKALYALDNEDYRYISYEFCEEETGDACEAFICIKDKESYGEKYFDILEVPVENIEMSWLDVTGSRMLFEDINFDGYRDLLFLGYPIVMSECSHCIGFLWNEKEQRYEWNASVPNTFRGIDTERKRITCIFTLSASDDDYRIYEYNGSVFTEKRLVVTWSREVRYRITWQYYEEGELLKSLEQNYDEDAKMYYITYEENGIVTEEVMEEADYDTKYGSYDELGMEYFPEFDFYWAG